MIKINKTLLISCSIFLLFLWSTIAYSAIASTFYISGTAKARIEKNVRITDFKVFSVSENVLSSYEEFMVNGVKAGITLPNSDSYITYKIEVTNYGYDNVAIESINGINSNLTYEISEYSLRNKICNNANKCNLGAKKEFFITIKYSNYSSDNVSFELNLEFVFKNYYSVNYKYIDNNGYPDRLLEGENLNVVFNADIPRKIKYYIGDNLSSNYSYSNGIFTASNIDGDVVIENGDLVRVVSGTGISPGDIIEIGDEAFYLMSNDGSNLTLMAKYNLYVGSVYSGNKLTNYGDLATGIQDSTMIAWKSSGQPWNGVTPYSSNGNYWYDGTGLNSKYGTSYPAYVYDSNSTLYNYVENYRDYLERLGAKVLDARLPSYEDVVGFGCVASTRQCSSAPSWIYSTTYWLGSAANNDVMWRISTNKLLDLDTDYYDFARGVRPVIVIPTSSIGASVSYVNIVNNNYPDYVYYNNDLIVNFTGDIPDGVNVFVGGKSYENYTYEDNCLVVNDVFADVIIYGDDKNVFDYSDGEEIYTVNKNGIYRLEVWGAQGGSYDSDYHGGYGAYASGEIALSKGDKLYVHVGGAGVSAPIPISSTFTTDAPYNGGGDAAATPDCKNFAASGGGATHIASISGTLSSLENSKDSIYIVASGGGGASSRYCSGSDYHYCSGGNGGGIQGGSALVFVNSGWTYTLSGGATQTAGGTIGVHNNEAGATAGKFGQGGSWDLSLRPYKHYYSAIGGGGGFYGGGGGMFVGGGGGSSYIGNSLLNNKAMYCYKCVESSNNDTKTISVESASIDALKNTAKMGNGYAKIVYLGN